MALTPKPRPDGIPTPAVRRLSLYLRELEALLDTGTQTISSRQLGETLGLSDAQVRKDLAYFGQFGQAGVGYRVEELSQEIRRILGTDRPWNVMLVGVGNLGRALLAYRGFVKKRFNMVAAFDADPALIGKHLTPDGVLVRPMREMAEVAARMDIRLGLLCVPAPAAQSVAEQMVAAGVQAILNFAPTTLNVPPTVAVLGVDLAVHLEQLSFHLTARDQGRPAAAE